MKGTRETDTEERLANLPLPHNAKVTRDLHFCLIVPPSPFVVPCGWEWTHTAPFEGPSIIASLVKGLGYRFTLLDQRDNPDPSALDGRLGEFDIIGIATYEDNFPYIKRATEIARADSPERPVVLGGPLVTSVPELLMKNTSADYAVVGEGELTLIELMDFLSRDERAKEKVQINGLVWRDKQGRIVKNQQREQMRTLDAVPLQDLSVWERFSGKVIPEIYLSYSRGCIADCTFCYRPFPKLRYKSVERVRKEIDYLKRHNFRMVWWNDLTFVTSTRYIHRLLKEAFTAHDFRWCCFTRVTGIDFDILKEMKERGCDIVLYGFESVTQDILDAYRKQTTKNDIVNAIKLTKEAGLKVGGLFIIGAPHETRETLANTVEFCQEFREVTRVKYLSAIPGTALYWKAVEEGLIKDGLAHLYFLAREQSVEEDINKEGFVLFSKHITKEDLQATYRTVNGTIERRPYDYTAPENDFLEEGKAFEKRPVTLI